MRTIIVSMSCCLLAKAAWAAVVFAGANSRTQSYIVASLAEAIDGSTIAILHSQCDDVYRTEGRNVAVQYALGLSAFRCVAVLKGHWHGDYSVFLYVYPPKRKLRTARSGHLPPPYRPMMWPGDELPRLVLMRPEFLPLKDRVVPSQRDAEMRRIAEAAMDLPEEAFIQKNNLADMFSNQVYRVMDACIFQADHPIPDLPETDNIRANINNLKAMKTRVPDLQEMSNLIRLSAREVSEIVFTAYWLEGAEGAAKYAGSCVAHPAVLVPLSGPADFETEIGKRLFDAVTAKKIPETEPPPKSLPKPPRPSTVSGEVLP